MIRIGRRARLASLVLAGCLAAAGRAIAGPIVPSPPRKLPDQRIKQAVALLAQGNLKQADAILQEVFGNEASPASALLARAQTAVSERRLQDAERAVASELSKNPGLPAAHAMMGVVLLLEQRPDESRQAFRRAVELQPRYLTPRLYLALIARAKGDFAGAVAEYQALTRAAPFLAAGHIGQAEAQMMLHNVPEAFRILEAWRKVPGAGPTPSYVIANLHLARGEHADAIRELEALIARTSGDAVAWTLLGDARLATGDQPKAVESYRTALKADPGNPVANNNLAWVLAEQATELDEALRLAKTASRRDPNYVDAFDTLGWIHFQRREYGEASAALARASKLAPDRLDIAAHLGLAYAKVGSKSLALTELRRALAGPAPVPNRDELQRVVAELSSTPK